jgi:hypothetical protein
LTLLTLPQRLFITVQNETLKSESRKSPVQEKRVHTETNPRDTLVAVFIIFMRPARQHETYAAFDEQPAQGQFLSVR